MPVNKMRGSSIFSVLKTFFPSAVKLADLRVLIDRVLWRKAASESASTRHKDEWEHFLYQVPSAETILYYILTEKSCGRPPADKGAQVGGATDIYFDIHLGTRYIWLTRHS